MTKPRAKNKLIAPSALGGALGLRTVRFLGWLLAALLFGITLLMVWRMAWAVAAPYVSPQPLVPTVEFVDSAAHGKADSVLPAPSIPGVAPKAASSPVDTQLAALLASDLIKREPVAAGAAETEPKTVDVVAALSLSVALITLLLSLAVPWLFGQIAAVSQIAAEVEEANAESLKLQSTLRSSQTLQSLWVDAQVAVLTWLDQQSVGGDAAGIAAKAQRIGLYLQALQSENEMTRRLGFAFLETQPWPAQLSWLDDTISAPLWRYQLACHRHQAQLQGIPPKQMWTQTGLWCQFWDPVERKRFSDTPPPGDDRPRPDEPPLPP